MAKAEKTLESSFEDLETILSKLEDNTTNLDDSFRLYQQGIKLLKTCNDSIDKIEKKIVILNESGENNEF